MPTLPGEKIGAELTKQAFETIRPFLDKILGPGAEEFGEALGDSVRHWRNRRLLRIARRAQEMIESAERDPRPIPLRTLVPLFEASSCEDEPTLAEMWSALLANTALADNDSGQHPQFVEILRQLSPTDARCVCLLDQHRSSQRVKWLFVVTDFVNDLGLTESEAIFSAESLAALGLARPLNSEGQYSINPEQLQKRWFLKTPRWVTPLGQRFIEACSPPLAEKRSTTTSPPADHE